MSILCLRIASSSSSSYESESLELSLLSFSFSLSTNYMPVCPYVWFSFTWRSSGTYFIAFSCLISSGEYFKIISHFSFWNSLREHITRSPTPIQTFFFILPRIWPILYTWSKHLTLTLPLPSIAKATPYYRPSYTSLVRSYLLIVPIFFPLLKFLPPLPLFFGIINN